MNKAVSSLDLSIYLVTDADMCHAAGRTVAQTVAEAVAGGVTCVQLRCKDAESLDFFNEVMEVADAVADSVTLLINDRVDVFLAARLAGANVAGVHVGQTDLPVALVRKLIGPEAIIGLSASTPEELKEAEENPGRVDYIGIGVVRDTSTKTDAPEEHGIDGTGQIARSTHLPSVAIGGIKAPDMAPLAREGLDGAAVVSAICLAPDAREAARELADQWAEGLRSSGH